MRALKPFTLGLLILAMTNGCLPASNSRTTTPAAAPKIETETTHLTPSDTPPRETIPPTATPKTENSLVRIRLATTSDWTTLNLLAGTTWLHHDLISSSDEITNIELGKNKFVLEQPIDRAEDGGLVEVVTESLFTPWGGGRPVVLQIERGDIGSTDLEVSVLVDGKWLVIKSAKWGGVTGGLNEYRVEIPANHIFGDISLPTPLAGQALSVETVDPVIGLPEGTDGFAWWNDTTFYEIFVRSFYDSDGDGIGDLNGIIQKLDYLNDGDPSTSADLGITGIWLMPIYPSPSYHGYNVTDFKDVNPLYGTLDDFRNLLEAAHQRGIRIILDFMVGQTSNQHPWFLNAHDPSSPYRDWYIWSDHDPGYLGSWGQQVWFPVEGSYLYSTYSEYTPDLNLNNPEVNAEIREAVRFWLEDIGVDGFRLDSAKHVIEEGEIQANSASTHEWWKDFRPFYKEINPRAVTVGEIWEHTSINAEYLQGDEFDLAFEFSLAYEIIKALNEENAEIVNDQIDLSYSLIPPLQFSTFLTNHDQDRLLDQLGYSTEKNKAAASLLLTAPGVPFIYYGEEIGLQGQKPDEHIRRPMQWSTDRYAGFSTNLPWEPLGPDWGRVNVSNQTDDPASLLSHYRKLIQARNQHAALRVGDLRVVTATDNTLYSILRVSQKEAVLVLVNLTAEPVAGYRLELEESSLIEGSYMPAAIIGEGEFAPLSTNSRGGFIHYSPNPEVPPFGTIILQLRKVSLEN